MWNRDDDETSEATDAADAPPEPATGGGHTGRGDRRAVIGASIEIQGEVTGSEDLTIQGHVDGSVTLEEHAVTVGPDGRVAADIVARVIEVEGRVDGDLKAEEQVALRGTARVEGDISAPRVVLDDGSYFRGEVDMGETSGDAGSTRSSTAGNRSSGAGSTEAGDAETGEGQADAAAGVST